MEDKSLYTPEELNATQGVAEESIPTEGASEVPAYDVSVSAEDIATIAEQLGREPRGVLDISYRCPDGTPGVVMTAPRLPDGTPFPTLFYLTDPRLVHEASRQESEGVMKGMTQRLNDNAALAENYRQAHDWYLQKRNSIEDLGTNFSGGGMPERVKCLHVLMAYSLSAGPGICILGDEAVASAAEHGLRGIAIPEEWPTVEDLISAETGPHKHESS